MLQGTRQNYHHSKLPKMGEIGRIIGLSTVNAKRKCIIDSFPLCDNVLPYSKGIHCVNVRFLDNDERRKFSAIWFDSE